MEEPPTKVKLISNNCLSQNNHINHILQESKMINKPCNPIGSVDVIFVTTTTL